jgi:hypothetical protein
MATTGDYWRMADVVHWRNQNAAPTPGWFTCDRFESSKSFFAPKANRNGFQAAVYTDGQSGEKVLAIAGTQGAALNDLLADVRVLAQLMPRQASAALKFYRSVIDDDDDDEVVIVGHSLGGGLAQVLGYWCNRPFVTFNAPGMASVLGAARHNLFKPQVRQRTRAAQAVWEGATGSRGLNFRIARDVVGKFGKHVGDVIVLNHNPGFVLSHQGLEPALRNHLVNGTPLWDLDPFAVL